MKSDGRKGNYVPGGKWWQPTAGLWLISYACWLLTAPGNRSELCARPLVPPLPLPLPLQHGRPQAWTRGDLPFPPLEMLESVFLLQMLSKTSVDGVFMHHFEKMSSASGGFWELSLDPAGGLPSFKPPHCPPLEKILWTPTFTTDVY